MNIRLGIAGYGMRGRHLLKMASRSFPGIEPAGVCETDTENRARAEKDFPEIPGFTDFHAMLESVPLDAVIVETPATCHARLCSRALKKNIHVMSDVPAVTSINEARELWQAQEASEAFYMLGANPNTWGFVDAAAGLIKTGTLGDPYYMEAEYIHDIRDLFAATPWRKTYESIRYCTHSLGPLLRLIDEDLDSVSCFDTGSHVNREEGQHDAMAALFRTRSGVTVRLLTSFINNYPGHGHGYRVYGTKGYFERRMGCKSAGEGTTYYYSPADHDEKALHKIEAGETPRDCGGKTDDGHGGADYAVLNRFFTAIREKQPSPIPLREGLRMTLPGIAAAQSARQGGELVHIRYPWSGADGEERHDAA